MVDDKHAGSPAPNSHLFTLRLWPEDLGGGQIDWRGKVQHVNSGEARYFRDWWALEAFVEGLLHRNEPSGVPTDRTAGVERASPET